MPSEASKVFVGAMPVDSTVEGLTDYFNQFGKVTEVLIMKDLNTGVQRGFGFVTFTSIRAIDRVLAVSEHPYRGKNLDPKPALLGITQPKLFVGSIPLDATQQDVIDYFNQFGVVQQFTISIDKVSGKSRGYGFLTYDN
ncbi:RNA-binding domain-containing protein, partial [Ramicandelaber brevisporus]